MGDYWTYGLGKNRQWVKQVKHPYGVGAYTLCEPCNNDTGGAYGQAYVEFAKRLAEISDNLPYRTPLNFKFKGFPSRIIRQVLTIFCSTSGSNFSEKQPWVRDYVMNQDAVSIPKNVGIYICLIDRRAKLSTGIAGILDIESQETLVMNEFLFWPLGCVLTFSGLSEEQRNHYRLTDITAWARFGYTKRATLPITLFKNYRLTGFPLDFRSKEEIEQGAGSKIRPERGFPFIR